MFEAIIDKPKNLLRVTYSGRVTPDEARRGSEELEKLLPDVKPGFRLLGDLTNLDEMDVACAPYIRQMMDVFNQRGVGLVVRVIPDPSKDIGMSIMSLFHYRRGLRIITCKTLEEALEALAAAN